MRKIIVHRCAIVVIAATAGLLGTALFAQEADEESVEEVDAIEEIIVFAPRPGDRRRVDEEYEDPVRAQLLKDFYEMQEDQEEFAWRETAAEDAPPRIAWGYDPSDEYELRNQMALHELPTERGTQPATLFRLKF